MLGNTLRKDRLSFDVFIYDTGVFVHIVIVMLNIDISILSNNFARYDPPSLEWRDINL